MKQFQFGAHVPWSQIESYLQLVLDLGLIPEIAIKGPELDALDHTQLEQVATKLSNMGLRPYIHAPFFDLNVGALDPAIRQVSQQRLDQALSFATRLNAALMVIHPGVDKWRYPNLEQVWLTNAIASFQALNDQASASDCQLAIENIYEESPALLVQLVNEIDSDWFGHCFDVGHWQLFGKRLMAEWLDAIAPRLFHLHLHDNHAVTDEHLPVGEGTIDFSPLQSKLQNLGALPSMTLEAHSLEHLKQSLKQVEKLLY